MGQWAITIHGHGIHDNGREDDAEVMTKKFVEELGAKGHYVDRVSITVGSTRHLNDEDEWEYGR